MDSLVSVITKKSLHQNVNCNKRKRKQVRRACLRCRKAKAGCSNERPCNRCVRLGIPDQCKDDIKSNTFITYTPSSSPPLDDIPSTNVLNFEDITKELTEKSKCTNVLNNIPDEEEYLQSEIESLENEFKQQENQISLLNDSLKFKQLFSGIALSRWRIHCFGVCQLISFSNRFKELLEKDVADLYNLTCFSLYSETHHFQMQKLYRFIGSNTVESVTTRVPVVAANNKILSILAIITVEFDNDIAVEATLCMEDFNPSYSIYGDIPYFEPIVQTLKNNPVNPITSMNYISSIPSTDYPKFTDCISNPIPKNTHTNLFANQRQYMLQNNVHQQTTTN